MFLANVYFYSHKLILIFLADVVFLHGKLVIIVELVTIMH